MPTSSQNHEGSTRDQLIEIVTRDRESSGGDIVWATDLVDTLVVETLSDAIEAARGEYLTDATGTPEDEAYQQAVADVIAAIDALRAAQTGGEPGE